MLGASFDCLLLQLEARRVGVRRRVGVSVPRAAAIGSVMNHHSGLPTVEVLTTVRTIRDLRRRIASSQVREASSELQESTSLAQDKAQEAFERRLNAQPWSGTMLARCLLAEEKASLDACPLPRGFHAEVDPKEPLRWIVSVPGLPLTVHDGAGYRFVLLFTDEYPAKPPAVTIANVHHFHPNISSVGKVYSPVFSKGGSPPAALESSHRPASAPIPRPRSDAGDRCRSA